MAAITLPAIGGAILRRAGDHVAFATVVAHTAAADVVEDHAVAFLEAFAAGTQLHDLPARLVAGDHTLVAFGAVPQVFAIDGANVAATDRRRFHLDQHLAVAWLRHIELSKLDSPPAGQQHPSHLHGRLAFQEQYDWLQCLADSPQSRRGGTESTENSRELFSLLLLSLLRDLCAPSGLGEPAFSMISSYAGVISPLTSHRSSHA